MQATQFFASSSISFCILGHRKNLVSVVIFLYPACLKCSVSISFSLNSLVTTIRSSLKVNPHLLLSFSNVVRYAIGAVFFSFRLIASLSLFNSASVADFAISVLGSSMKLNSAFLIVSSVAFLFPVMLSITWFIWINCVSFPSVLKAFKSTIGKLSPRIIWLSPSLSGSAFQFLPIVVVLVLSTSTLSSRGWYPPQNLFARVSSSPSISAISCQLLLFGLEGTHICLWAFMSSFLLIVPGRDISNRLSTNLSVSGSSSFF